jgi:serine/threonine protein kinase
MPLDPGTTFADRYRIERLHKVGSMGTVYLAFDPVLRTNVAIKENLFSTPDYQRQFSREAQFLATFRHPNIPRATDHFIIEGRGQFLVMSFVEGRTAREWSESDFPTPPEILSTMQGVFEALQYIHSLQPPVIHRDVEPTNIIVTSGGIAFLVDFGLAKLLSRLPGPTTDARSDQYSLAATLYALMTRQIPADSLGRAVGHQVLKRPSTLNPAIPLPVEDALMRALSVKGQDRFPAITDFWHAISKAV